MNLILLEKGTYEPIEIIDKFDSAIWTDRYCEPGDFELVVPASSWAAAELVPDRYLWNRESEHLMVLEDITIDSDVEYGEVLTVTGRSLESLLERRIIWSVADLSGNMQTQLRDKVYNPNAISPSDAKRKIPGLVFKLSEEEAVTSQEIDQQFTGKDLLEITQSVLSERDLGFRIVMDASNQMIFSFYGGTDRSYDNAAGNNYVVFSPQFENLINSKYYLSYSTWRNACLVAGEDKDRNRKLLEIPGTAQGIDRRELYVDARDIQDEIHNDDGSVTTLTAEQYNARLQARGIESLLEKIVDEVFEAETDPSTTFIYGKDYFLGDIVELENEYGIARKVRVTEMVHSADENGETVIPGFTILD